MLLKTSTSLHYATPVNNHIKNKTSLTVAVKAIENGLNITNFGRLFKCLAEAAANQYSQSVITLITSLMNEHIIQ